MQTARNIYDRIVRLDQHIRDTTCRVATADESELSNIVERVDRLSTLKAKLEKRLEKFYRPLPSAALLANTQEILEHMDEVTDRIEERLNELSSPAAPATVWADPFLQERQ